MKRQGLGHIENIIREYLEYFTRETSEYTWEGYPASFFTTKNGRRLLQEKEEEFIEKFYSDYKGKLPNLN